MGAGKTLFLTALICCFTNSFTYAFEIDTSIGALRHSLTGEEKAELTSRWYELEFKNNKEQSLNYCYTPISWPIDNAANNGHLHRITLNVSPTSKPKNVKNQSSSGQLYLGQHLDLAAGLAVSSNRLKYQKFDSDSFFLFAKYHYVFSVKHLLLNVGLFNDDSRGNNKLQPFLGLAGQSRGITWEVNNQQLVTGFDWPEKPLLGLLHYRIRFSGKRDGERWSVLNKSRDLDSTVSYRGYAFRLSLFWKIADQLGNSTADFDPQFKTELLVRTDQSYRLTDNNEQNQLIKPKDMAGLFFGVSLRF